MKNRLYELIFSIDHEDCWTTMVGKFIVRNIGREINIEKNYIRAVIILDRKYINLIRSIKKHKSFISYSAFYGNGDKIIFDFKKNTHGVIRNIISLDGIIMDDFKYMGSEYWKILIYEDRIQELFGKLQSEGSIKLWGYRQYEVTEQDLTPQELKSLVMAYTKGYFNFPKKAKSGEVAKLVGIDKSTFIYHLRSAESKLIKRYLDQLKFENIINMVHDNAQNSLF